MFMRARRSFPMLASGSSTARPNPKVRNTSQSACLLFRWKRCIETRDGTQPCPKGHHSESVLPMLSLRKPSAEKLQDFLATQSKLDFTYPAVGATAAVPPAGYVVDRTRIKLGEGPSDFAAAQAALRRWEHFHLGWMKTWPPETPIQAGQVVAVIARIVGLWWL